MNDPATQPFFLVGGALSVDAPSYIDRAADKRLFASLQQGEFCYVLVSRQMGKSSLMIRTASRLREAGSAAVLLDLNAIGHHLDQKQWYYSLMRQIARRLNLRSEVKAYWEQTDDLSPMQKWLAVFQDVILPLHPGPIVIFIDEIDQLRLLPFSTDEFFAGIRSCYSRRPEDAEFRRLTFCLLGVALPADLIRDARLTPFNIGTHIELTDFDRNQIMSLKVGLGGEVGLEESLLERVYYWTNGHPYLTQSLCRAIAESPNVLTPKDVDTLCTQRFLSLDAQEQDDNLAFVRKHILENEADSAELLDLYRQVISRKRVGADKANRLVNILLLSGIVRSQNGELVVRNRIYATVFNSAWVREHMPDAERRRQRAAYRRGVLRAMVVTGSILTAVMALVSLAAYKTHQDALVESEKSANVSKQQALESANRASKSEKKAMQLATDNQRLFLKESQLAQKRKDALVQLHQSLERERQAEKVEQHLMEIAQKETKRAEKETKLAAKLAMRAHYNMDMNLLERNWESKNFGVMRKLLKETEQEKYRFCRGFEWGYWNHLCHLDLMTLDVHTGVVSSAVYSPDGSRIVTGREKGVAEEWDAVTGKSLLPIKGSNGKVGFSPDGQRIVSQLSTDWGLVGVWDAHSGRQLLPHLVGHTAIAGPGGFSPDGLRIVTASLDGTARVWDAKTGKELHTLRGHRGSVSAASFSPNGLLIVTASLDGTARVWDAQTGQELQHPYRHNGSVFSAAFSPDSRHIVTGCNDNMAILWDVQTENLIQFFRGHSRGVLSASFSPDGTRIVTGSFDRTAKVWDVQTGREMFTLNGHNDIVGSATFSPDGKRIVTASADHTAKVWDAQTSKESLTLTEHIAPVNSVAISPDGKWILLGSGDTAKVLNAHTGQERFPFPLKGHTGEIYSVAFSPDGRRFVTASGDHTARVWNAQTGQITCPFNGHTSVVTSAAFSPDGRQIVTGSWDKTVQVWDAKTGESMLTIKGHTSSVRAVAFSYDGTRIITGSEDGTARVWESSLPASFRKQYAPKSIGPISFTPNLKETKRIHDEPFTLR